MRDADEYFQRFQRVKNAIEANAVVKNSIESIISSHYSKKKISEETKLEEGEHHIVYSAGHVELQDKIVHLALRFNKDFVYCSKDDMWITSAEIGAFVEAFMKNKSVPYFVGAVASNDFGAVIIEDITEGKKYSLEKGLGLLEDPDIEGVYKISGRIFKKRELFFIDPIYMATSVLEIYGKRYISDENILRV